MHTYYETSLTVEAERELWLLLQSQCDVRWFQELNHCVRNLAELLIETHDRPIEELAEPVRHLIVENCQVDDAGDAPVHDEQSLENQIRIVLRGLDRVRHVHLRRGDWSDMPVPPLMCG
jgi:hypothetical protein